MAKKIKKVEDDKIIDLQYRANKIIADSPTEAEAIKSLEALGLTDIEITWFDSFRFGDAYCGDQLVSFEWAKEK